MKKSKKEKRPKLDFMQKLERILQESGIGEVVSGDMGDNSGRFLSIQKGDTKLEIRFDMKGQKITDIILVEDEYSKTGEKMIFAFGRLEKPKEIVGPAKNAFYTGLA